MVKINSPLFVLSYEYEIKMVLFAEKALIHEIRRDCGRGIKSVK